MCFLSFLLILITTKFKFKNLKNEKDIELIQIKNDSL